MYLKQKPKTSTLNHFKKYIKSTPIKVVTASS